MAKQEFPPCISILLRQRRLRWLGHVRRMDDGRILKDLLYGELAKGKRLVARPKLLYKDVCKRDMKATGSNAETWDALTKDRNTWRAGLHKALLAPSWSGTSLKPQRRKERRGMPVENFQKPYTRYTLSARTAVVSANHELDCLVTHSKSSAQPAVR